MTPPKRSQVRKVHRTAREIRRLADEVLENAARRAKDDEKKGLHSVTLPRADLIRKLSGKTAHSPFLTSIGWGNAVRGSNFVLRFDVMNPDPWPYSNDNLGLCVYWSPAGGVLESGASLSHADVAVGTVMINFPYLNPSTSSYSIPADHMIPATMRPGRNDVCYLLYSMDAFQRGVELERGALGVVIG